jgi:hypothetical protein
MNVRNGALGAEGDRDDIRDQLNGRSGSKGRRVAAVVVHDPDPFGHLTPAERYAQAIQRRDAIKSANKSSAKSSL